MSFFTLKFIALLSMLWDHISYAYPPILVLLTLFPSIPIEPLETLTHVFHYIGRISAPIFLWSIANGYRNTRDFKKYAFRILIFACLSEWPYYLLFESHGNVLFTYFFGLLTLRLMDWGNDKRPGAGYALAVPVVILAWCFPFFEGDGRYILFILAYYLTDHWSISKKILLWLFLYPSSRWQLLKLCLSEGLRLSIFTLNAFGPLLGVGLTFFYNKKKGPDIPGSKWLWYTAYPVHLLILGLLSHYTQLFGV